MTRRRRTRAVLSAVTALIAGWLMVLGTATAAPAQTPAPATVDGTARTPARAAEQDSPLVAVPPGVYRIKNRSSEGCLRGGPVTHPQFREPALYVPQGSGCNNDANALWILTPANPDYGSQYMEVRSVAYSGRCLDANYSKNGQPTGIMRLYTCHGDPNQAWDFTAGTASYGGLVCGAQHGSCDRLLQPYGPINGPFGGQEVRFGERATEGANWYQWWILERIS